MLARKYTYSGILCSVSVPSANYTEINANSDKFSGHMCAIAHDIKHIRPTLLLEGVFF